MAETTASGKPSITGVIGVFGGTFNPPHRAHVHCAREARERLRLDQLVLIPAAAPPLKDAPSVSAQHRAAMLEAAIAGEPGLSIDTRELQREGPSFTVDTLSELRAEWGETVSIVFCMGTDSAVSLHRWSRWEALFELAHIAVLARPGVTARLAPEVDAKFRSRRGGIEALRKAASGSVIWLEQPELDLSSTDVRARLAAGQSVESLLPEPVIRYIKQHDLYPPE